MKRDHEESWRLAWAHDFERNIKEFHATKKIFAKNLLKEAVACGESEQRGAKCRHAKNNKLCCKESKNMQLPGMMVRRAIKAGWADDWSELVKSEELQPWMMAKLKESHHQARRGGRLVQEHRAAGHVEEHGLLEADHRTS